MASRIGAVGADITDVAVAGRDTGMAIDVFHLTLPRSDVDLIALLRHELAEVDAALLTDALPPAAYADPGFLQFLKGNP